MTDSQHEVERLSDDELLNRLDAAVEAFKWTQPYTADTAHMATTRIRELLGCPCLDPNLDPELWGRIGNATFLTDGEKRTLLGVDALLNDINRKTIPEGK